MQISKDGFSYHTLLMKKLLGNNEYKKIKNSLYEAIKTEHCKVYAEDNYIKSNQFKDYGILIKLKKNDKNFFHLELRINPVILLGNIDYSRIFSCNKDNVDLMCNKLNLILESIGASFKFNDMWISRIDLCVNVEFNDKEITDAYMRIFKKCKLPNSFKLDTFKTEIEMEVENNYIRNKNSFKAISPESELSIYNKLFQLKEKNLVNYIDENIAGIIRIEVIIKRNLILNIINKITGNDSLIENDQILIIMGHFSKLIIVEYLKKFFLRGTYFTYNEAKSILDATKFKKKTKKRMLLLLEKVSECKNMNSAIKKIKEENALTNYQIDNIISKFEDINLNPITLCNNSNHIDFLPSIFELLAL